VVLSKYTSLKVTVTITVLSELTYFNNIGKNYGGTAVPQVLKAESDSTPKT